MRALVTGANGLLGRYLCEYARQRGHQVLATGRGAGRIASPVPYVACALEDAAPVGKLLEQSQCEIVIHCAAQLAGGNGPSYLQNNLTATLNLAQAAKQQSISKFIFCSTTSVYPGDGPFRESAPTHVEDHYAASKVAAENALNLLADDEFNVAILRMAGLHGRPRANGVIYAMLEAALAGRPIHINEPETQLSISFMGDAAATIFALCQLQWPQPGAIYNLASPDAPSLLELARMILSETGSVSELQFGNGAARNRVLDVSKLEQEMGIVASTVPCRIREALSDWGEWNLSGE